MSAWRQRFDLVDETSMVCSKKTMIYRDYETSHGFSSEDIQILLPAKGMGDFTTKVWNDFQMCTIKN